MSLVEMSAPLICVTNTHQQYVPNETRLLL